MIKKLILFSTILMLFFSCNKVIDTIDEVRMNKKQTISYDDYEAILNDDDIKFYYDTDKELMTGHFVVVYQGKPAEEFQLKRGYLNGIYASYNADGQLTKAYNYKNGLQEGKQQEFYPTGELISETDFEKGEKVGEKIVYDKSGVVRSKQKTENGVEYNRYYKDGKLVMAEFTKEWQGKQLEMLVHYDAFENIQFAFGKSTDTSEENIFYVFDANMQLTDTVDVTLDPQKAAYYFRLIQRTSESLMQ